MQSLFVPLFFVLVPLALAAVGGALAWRAERPPRRRALLQGFAYGLIGLPAAFFVLMLVGESITDLGPGTALAMIGPWALAAIGYLTLAWIRPDVALGLVTVLTPLPLGLGAWSAIDPVGFGAWLDSVGPQNLIATQFLVVVSALAARRHPRLAGTLIMVITAVPALLPLAVSGAGASRVAIAGALSLPAFLAGVLTNLAGTPAFVGSEA